MKRSKGIIAAIVAASVAVALMPAVVVASIITNATAVAVKVTAKLKTNSVAVLKGTSGPLTGYSATCTAFTSTFQLTTKGGGLGPFTLSNPAVSGCTDNVGGTDTVTSNKTNGPWTATYVNSTGSPSPDLVRLSIPKAGLKLVSSAYPSCIVTYAPSAAGIVSGSYDNAGNLQFTNASISYSATGTCPPGTGSGTATLTSALKSGAAGTPGFSVSPVIFGIP